AVRATPETSNLMGPAGALLAHEGMTTLGVGWWVVVLAVGGALAHLAWRGPISHLALRLLGVGVIACAAAAMHALVLPSRSSLPEGGGGLVGIVLAHVFGERFGVAGTLLVLATIAAIGATIAFDRWLVIVPRLISAALRRTGAVAARTGHATLSTVKARATEAGERSRVEARRRRGLGSLLRRAAARPIGANDDESETPPIKSPRRDDLEDEPVRVSAAEEDEEWVEEDEDADWVDEVETPEDADEDEEDDELSDTQIREKIDALPVFFGASEAASATQADLEALRAERAAEDEAERSYVFPPLDLLEEPEADFNERLEAYVREQAEALEHALHQYRIKGAVTGIESGPVITLYHVKLAPGTKVAAVEAVDKDIARALKAVNIRIVPNTEGRDTVGVEVPNQTKEKVRLKELMTSSDSIAKMKLPMFLGKDASGRPLVSDLAKLPHMLIAGTTGSGKSVCMNAIIMGFLYTQKPTDLKMVLVDPKMVEMSQFKDIPHLLCPVVTEMGKAAAILEWAVQKMDERYELLAEAGCRDISSYNKLTWEELLEIFQPDNELQEAKIPRKLPYMVFVIDELADLMMTNKEVEGSIVRIAQKARAVGIHLILATQRPQANVVTGLIKSNMPGRVSFRVASGVDSRIVLDQKGGELLLGQGDMLMITPRSSQAMRAQGTLVDDDEIRKVVRFVKEHGTASYSRELVTLKDSGFDALDADPYSAEAHEQKMRESAQEDPLFDRAVEIVLETRRGSVSLLQRRLAIGYTRASRLIEMMGFCGIIGQHKGSVAREVLMTPEHWEQIKARAQARGDEADASLFTGDDDPEAGTVDEDDIVASEPGDLALDTDDVPFDVDEDASEAAVAVHARKVDGASDEATVEPKPQRGGAEAATDHALSSVDQGTDTAEVDDTEAADEESWDEDEDEDEDWEDDAEVADESDDEHDEHDEHDEEGWGEDDVEEGDEDDDSQASDEADDTEDEDEDPDAEPAGEQDDTEEGTDEGEWEYEYVDEDGNPVDEDGNPIDAEEEYDDDEADEDEEWEESDELDEEAVEDEAERV
ncbi:MAG: DNA translocase FtsK 4TM domain-containing protein, partial [Planctomycetota bacterium]